jgi:hypothetical protein
MHVSVELQDGTSMEVEGGPEELFEFLTKFGIGAPHTMSTQARLYARTDEGDSDADRNEAPSPPATGSDMDPPPTGVLADFIEGQDSYMHSLQSVIRYFVGEEIPSRDEDGEQNKVYNRWAKRISRAREKVAEEKGLEWEHDWMDGEKWFKATESD